VCTTIPAPRSHTATSSGRSVDDSLPELAQHAFAVTFGERGLFLYSPILLIAVYGLVRGLRSPSSRVMRRVLRFIAVSSLFYIVSVVLGTTDYGGDAYGLRRFVGIALLMCLSLSPIWEELRSQRFARCGFRHRSLGSEAESPTDG